MVMPILRLPLSDVDVRRVLRIKLFDQYDETRTYITGEILTFKMVIPTGHLN